MKTLFLIFGLSLFASITGHSQSYATLYSDCNFRGTASKLYPGRHNLSQASIGMNSLSSIRVPNGLKVIIYTGSEPGTGTKMSYTNDISCLPREFNDRAGAVVIEEVSNNEGNNSGNYYPGNNNGNNHEVTVYSECNYNGSSAKLQPGYYNPSQLGVGNDNISSMRIPSGVKVTVYTDAASKGQSRSYTYNIGCLPQGINDNISSMYIEVEGANNNHNSGYNNNSGNQHITVYADCSYKGNSATLEPGYYSPEQLGVGNDNISSIKVPYGLRVTIYTDAASKGQSKVYTNNVNCLPQGFNDRVSSVWVESTSSNNNYNNNNNNYNNDNGSVITVYANSWFSGSRMEFGPGSYNLEDGMAQNISSINIPQGYEVVLFDDYDFRGSRTTLTISSANLSGIKWNDKARSMVVRRRN